jgi:hypothetical protein
MTIQPKKTFNNPTDGHTYFLAPLEGEQGDVLWASPTNADDSTDFEYAIPVASFEEPLPPEKRKKILHALEQPGAT